MASAWVSKRTWMNKNGKQTRYRVLYRLGGREQRTPSYYGSFSTKKEAEKRCNILAGMLAAGVTQALPHRRSSSSSPPPSSSRLARFVRSARNGARPGSASRMAPPKRTE